MDKRPVLVATADQDPTADMVIEELDRRRVPVVRFDPGRMFPAPGTLSAHTSARGWGGTMTIGARHVDLGAVRAYYHRRPSRHLLTGDDQAERFAAHETWRGLGGVLGALPGCLYVSHPLAIGRAEFKPTQLAIAGYLGLRVPATLITNDVDEAKAFCADHTAIYKPLHAHAYTVGNRPAGIYAAPVTAGELTDAVRACPHLFQERIDKAADVRVTVVGDRVFGARITSPPGVLDWRSDYANLAYDEIGCPAEVITGVQHMLSQFGLLFGAFDFAVTPAGEWWFLELNPNGQWAWVEDQTGLPIASALADLLQHGETRT
ncbi:ATP-grasp ribosomal peptide maturase [Embleya sp. NPDC127516]|uniref:ATP-grasp ribosomal peptide maturase n=1 Tax=Embleya sp. NPDC127516 TaxID=3363990 RepID=UPI00382736F9